MKRKCLVLDKFEYVGGVYIKNGNSSYTSIIIGAMRKSEITDGKKVNG